jgi:hypothetical protein
LPREIERFGTDSGRLHVDLTTVRVAGAYEDSALVAKGWGSDRRIARQVRTLQAASGDGVSLYLRPDPGNCSELALVGASPERLSAFAKPGMLMVCDSALGQPKPLWQIHRSGLHFIVPLKAQTGFEERYLADVGPERLRRAGPGSPHRTLPLWHNCPPDQDALRLDPCIDKPPAPYYTQSTELVSNHSQVGRNRS